MSLNVRYNADMTNVVYTRTEQWMTLACKLGTVVLAAETGDWVVPMLAYLPVQFVLLFTSRSLLGLGPTPNTEE
jgi:hypothetical protein